MSLVPVGRMELACGIYPHFAEVICSSIGNNQYNIATWKLCILKKHLISSLNVRENRSREESYMLINHGIDFKINAPFFGPYQWYLLINWLFTWNDGRTRLYILLIMSIIMMSSDGNFFCVTVPLCGESKGSLALLPHKCSVTRAFGVSLLSVQTNCWKALDWPVIQDHITVLWCQCKKWYIASPHINPWRNIAKINQ